MITKKEMDNILTDVNRILSNLDDRIKALESSKNEEDSKKSSNSSKKT